MDDPPVAGLGISPGLARGEHLDIVGDPTGGLEASARVRTGCATKLLELLLVLTLPTLAQAQFDYTINNGTITITGYTGSGGAVTIPGTIKGLPVTGIGSAAFSECTNLTDVTIPDSVATIELGAFQLCTSLTNILIPNSVTMLGGGAFWGCHNLISITIPDGVTSIGHGAFLECTSLSRVTIPHSVTSIGLSAFCSCTSLTNITIPTSVTRIEDNTFAACTSLGNITIPDSVTRIGWEAFVGCTKLAGVYFEGNAPDAGSEVFRGSTNVTVYYRPGAIGWGTAFAGRPTALWVLPNPIILTAHPNFGIQTNAFGFIISWVTNISVVVDACTNPANATWLPVRTNALAGGWSYFSDPHWTNYRARFYRVRSR